jgi:hypothetical protein
VGDDLIFTYSAAFADKHVGEDKPINFTSIEIASGEDKDNYHLATTEGTAYADITEKSLNVLNAIAQSKTYDGNDFATILGAVPSEDDLLIGDVVTLLNHTIGIFSQAGVGESINVTTDMTLAGDDSHNYVIVQPVGLTANIEHRPLTITANSLFKPFGELLEFVGTEFTTDNLVASDEVTQVELTSEGAAANATPGDYQIVITPDSETGDGLENYDISYAEGTLSVRKEISVEGLIADNKVYDGTTEAFISDWGYLEGITEGDDVTIDHSSASATFDTKNVGTDKVVTIVGLQIAGNDSEFYMLSSSVIVVNADIFAKELTVADAIADDKIYDGGVSATILGAVLVGVIANDDVEFDALVGIFDSKNVGINKDVTAALTLIGSDVGNYTLEQPTGLTADITHKDLTVTGAVAADKVYDGTIAATITGAALSGAIEGDNVTLDALVGTFDQAIVGEDIPVTAALTITGDDIENYTFSQPTGLLADITALELTIGGSFTADDKVYDGTVAATIDASGLTLLTPITGDAVSLINVVAEFEDAEVGDNKTVSITAAQLDGVDKSNYTLSLVGAPTTIASITEPPVTQYTLAITIVGNGSVEVDGEAYTETIVVDEGTVLNLEAIADAGWQFDGWTGDVTEALEATTTITMDADKAITATFTIVDNVETGLFTNLKVFPNPFSSHITLENVQGVSRVTITNLIGHRVMEIQFSGADSETIQTEGLVKGIYLITFQAENGERLVKKMVKE